MMICFGLVMAAGFAALSLPADAQDNTAGRLSAVETEVAAQGTQVSGLHKRVKRLEAAVLTPEAKEVATTEASTNQPTGEQATTVASAAGAHPTATGAMGTRDNPVPIGTAADLGGGWSLTVVDVIPNGTDQILAENQFNNPPAEGRQFFMVTISATYNGQNSSTFNSAVSLSAVGASNVAYKGFEDRCGVIPNQLSSSEVFGGGAITGNVCWSVRSDDVDSLVMFSDSYVTFNAADRVYFSLQKGA
jgi:hypothetical protein